MPVNPYIDRIRSLRPVGYWPLDDLGTTSVRELVGSYAGTFNGSGWARGRGLGNVPAVVGTAGSTAWLSVAYNAAMSVASGPVTVEAWVRLGAEEYSTNGWGVFAKGYPGYPPGGWSDVGLSINHDKSIQFSVNSAGYYVDTAGTAQSGGYPARYLVPFRWYHVVGVQYSTGFRDQRIYVNGERWCDNGANNSAYATDRNYSTYIAGNNAGIYNGAWSGSIAHVSLFNRALPLGEIIANYELGQRLLVPPRKIFRVPRFYFDANTNVTPGLAAASTSTSALGPNAWPSGEGATSNWTNNGGANKTASVTDDSDSTYINSGTTSGTKQQFALPDASGTWLNGATISRVDIVVRFARGGAQNGSLIVSGIIGASQSNSAAQTATSSIQNYTYAMTTKPGGGSWTPSDFDSLVVEVKNNSARDVRVYQIFVVVWFTAPTSYNITPGSATGATSTATGYSLGSLAFTPTEAAASNTTAAGFTEPHNFTPGEAAASNTTAAGYALGAWSFTPTEAAASNTTAAGYALGAWSFTPTEAAASNTTAAGFTEPHNFTPTEAAASNTTAAGYALGAWSFTPTEAAASNATAAGYALGAWSFTPGEAAAGNSTAAGYALGAWSFTPTEAAASNTTAAGFTEPHNFTPTEAAAGNTTAAGYSITGGSFDFTPTEAAASNTTAAGYALGAWSFTPTEAAASNTTAAGYALGAWSFTPGEAAASNTTAAGFTEPHNFTPTEAAASNTTAAGFTEPHNFTPTEAAASNTTAAGYALGPWSFTPGEAAASNTTAAGYALGAWSFTPGEAAASNTTAAGYAIAASFDFTPTEAAASNTTAAGYALGAWSFTPGEAAASNTTAAGYALGAWSFTPTEAAASNATAAGYALGAWSFTPGEAAASNTTAAGYALGSWSFTPTEAAAGKVPWWSAISGAVAAYDPILASSLSDSYTNRANPGTYNAYPGTAPSWANGTGWIGSSAGQKYLLSGLVIGDGVATIIVRFSGLPSSNLVNNQVTGARMGTADRAMAIVPVSTTGGQGYVRYGNLQAFFAQVTGGIITLVGTGAGTASRYFIGKTRTNLGNAAWSGTNTYEFALLANNTAGTLSGWIDGNFVAGIYFNRALSDAEQAIVHDRMAALTGSGDPGSQTTAAGYALGAWSFTPGEAAASNTTAAGYALGSWSFTPGEAAASNTTAAGYSITGGSFDFTPGEAAASNTTAAGYALGAWSFTPGEAAASNTTAAGYALGAWSFTPGEAAASNTTAAGFTEPHNFTPTEAVAGTSTAAGFTEPHNFTPGEAAASNTTAAGYALGAWSFTPGEAAASNTTAAGYFIVANFDFTPGEAAAETSTAADYSLSPWDFTPTEAAAETSTAADYSLGSWDITFGRFGALARNLTKAGYALGSWDFTPTEAAAETSTAADYSLSPWTVTPTEAAAGASTAAVYSLGSWTITPTEAAAGNATFAGRAGGPPVAIVLSWVVAIQRSVSTPVAVDTALASAVGIDRGLAATVAIDRTANADVAIDRYVGTGVDI